MEKTRTVENVTRRSKELIYIQDMGDKNITGMTAWEHKVLHGECKWQSFHEGLYSIDEIPRGG